jgi:hypothetical protein
MVYKPELVRQQAGGNPYQRYLGLFPAGDAGLARYLISTGVYATFLAYKSAHGLYTAWRFGDPVVGSNTPYANIVEARKLVLSRDDDHESITYSMSGWSSVNDANAYGGEYRRNSTTGAYVEWTAPACEWLSMYVVYSGNAGAFLVTIDGDATKANLLPTAQQLVDGGNLASTVLVANGGTLNPTDRIIDAYLNLWDAYEFYHAFLADNLTNEAHTVRVTVTGYKDVGSSGVRLYFAGYGYGNDALTCASSGASLLKYYTTSNWTISNALSIWEFAYQYKPTGATNFQWMGHTDSLKYVSRAYTQDGEALTPANDSLYGGYEIIMTQVSEVKHPESGPNVGSVTVAYKVGSSGLRVVHDLTWLVAGQGTAYPAMMPMLAAFNRGKNAISPTNYTLSANDDSVVANAKSKALLLWQQTGLYGAMLYFPNLALINGFVNCTTSFAWLQDRSDTINKGYISRSDTNESIAINDVWRSDAIYRVTRFASGAEAALA